MRSVRRVIPFVADREASRIVKQAERRPGHRVLIQAHAQACALLRNIEDLLRHDQTHVHESTALPLEAATGPDGRSSG